MDGGKDYVRGKIADYFNDLMNIGVSGFRVDASKHMWPGDLEAIQVSMVDIIIILKGMIENLKTISFLKWTDFRMKITNFCLLNIVED